MDKYAFDDFVGRPYTAYTELIGQSYDGLSAQFQHEECTVGRI